MSVKSFTHEELRKYDGKANNPLYICVHGKVYDVTKFREEHPGGEEVLMEEGGQDATDAFESIGHSEEARDILTTLEVGELEGGAPPSQPKPTPPSHTSPQKEESSSLINYFIPVVVIIAYIAYKYVSSA